MENKKNTNICRPYHSDVQKPAFGKVLPQATDVEEAVLGAVMLETDAYSTVSDILSTESFYERKNQLIYEAIQQLALNQEPIDMLTVTDRLQHNGVLEEVGGAYYIASLTGKVGSAAHVEYHANIVAKKALARDLINFASNIEKNAYDETTDIDELTQAAENELFQLSNKNKSKDYEHISISLKEVEKDMERASSTLDGISGLRSGFLNIDKVTSGWQNTDLIIIGARPAMGKSAFLLSMAKNIAIDNGIPVGIFSLEMSNKQNSGRIIQNVCNIKGDDKKTGKIDWNDFIKKASNIYKAPIYYDDTPSLPINELMSKARRMVSKDKVKIIMIDYLQLVTVKGIKFGTREQEVSYVSRELKGLAKKLNIPIIALAQLNRGVDSRENKRPLLGDLRDSGGIEQDADMVAFLHRPSYYATDKSVLSEEEKRRAEFILAKNRYGEVKILSFCFEAEYARFIDSDAGNDNCIIPQQFLNQYGNSQNSSISTQDQEPAPF